MSNKLVRVIPQQPVPQQVEPQTVVVQEKPRPLPTNQILFLQLQHPATKTIGINIDPLELLLTTAGLPTIKSVLEQRKVLQEDIYHTDQQGATTRRYTVRLPPKTFVTFPLGRLGGDLILSADVRGRPVITVPLGLVDDVRRWTPAHLIMSEERVNTPSGASYAFVLVPKRHEQLTLELWGHKLVVCVLGWAGK